MEVASQWAVSRRTVHRWLARYEGVLVTDGTLQYWVGNDLVKTVARQTKGEIRKKHADGTAPTRARSA